MPDPDLLAAAARMRDDWNQRAREDAERFIYTGDQPRDIAEFGASGRATYDQILRPYLPVLLNGMPARCCRALEIGCGVGRMTRWAAAEFGEVHGVDVAPAMIEQARERLHECGNVRLHVGSGYDLAFAADGFFDLVFSYIVFQHIPTRAAIENYVREAARVLKPGGAFKFQVNGSESRAFQSLPRDTWHGETFSLEEARQMIEAAGLTLVFAEGAGTQYLILTCRKGEWRQPRPSPYVWPGADWAKWQLRDGWGDPVDASWRPLLARGRTLFAVSESRPLRFYLGLYFWEEDGPEHVVEIAVNGRRLGSAAFRAAGDQYLEIDAPEHVRGVAEVVVEISPPCEAPVRALGFYTPRG